MLIIRDRNFEPIRRSHNLRAIMDHTRRNSVERVDIWEHKDGSATLGIAWSDGSTCATGFASFEVCCRWCARRHAFPPAHIKALPKGLS